VSLAYQRLELIRGQVDHGGGTATER
jgi:hypothetical protein